MNGHRAVFGKFLCVKRLIRIRSVFHHACNFKQTERGEAPLRHPFFGVGCGNHNFVVDVVEDLIATGYDLHRKRSFGGKGNRSPDDRRPSSRCVVMEQHRLRFAVSKHIQLRVDARRACRVNTSRFAVCTAEDKRNIRIVCRRAEHVVGCFHLPVVARKVQNRVVRIRHDECGSRRIVFHHNGTFDLSNFLDNEVIHRKEICRRGVENKSGKRSRRNRNACIVVVISVRQSAERAEVGCKIFCAVDPKFDRVVYNENAECVHFRSPRQGRGMRSAKELVKVIDKAPVSLIPAVEAHIAVRLDCNINVCAQVGI